jgi:hypothetical protein
VITIERPAARIDAALAACHLVTELLGGDLAMMLVAKVASVVVAVAATMRQRLHVIDHRSGPGASSGSTELAQAVRPLQAPEPLRLPCTPAKALDQRLLTVPPWTTRFTKNVGLGLVLLKPAAASFCACGLVAATAFRTATLSIDTVVRR